jgi:hypothetical protein
MEEISTARPHSALGADGAGDDSLSAAVSLHAEM